MDDLVSRRLTGPSGEELIVTLGAPTRVDEGEWVCPFKIGEDRHEAFGIDGMQALQLALERIRVLLEPHPSLSWEGGEVGDCGFPKAVPHLFGLGFARKINQMIEDEVEKFARDAQARRGKE